MQQHRLLFDVGKYMCSSMSGATRVVFTGKFWRHTQSVVSLSPCHFFSQTWKTQECVCLQVVCAPLDFAIFVRMIMTHMMFSICSTNPFYVVELVVGQLETKDNGLRCFVFDLRVTPRSCWEFTTSLNLVKLREAGDP